MLQTKDLLLREIRLNDTEDLYEIRHNPLSHEYTDTIIDETKEDTQSHIRKMIAGMEADKWYIWVIEYNGKVIGSISVWNIRNNMAELGYGLHPDYWGREYMKQALEAVCGYIFTHTDISVLEAYTEEHNRQSIRLLNKCNFEKVNETDDQGYFHDRVYHMLVYRMEKKR